MRSLLFLEDQVAVRSLDSPPSLARPRRAPRTDAAFLGSPLASATRRSRRCSGLGFAVAGRRRSKPVTWWRDGEAHVVVNESRQLGAGAGAGGPGAAAVGVIAPPVEAVAARAKALLWPAVDRTRGAGESLLPGITSPSGLHVFVSDAPGTGDDWQRDFVPSGAAATTGLAGHRPRRDRRTLPSG